MKAKASLEERMAKVEGILEQIDKRLNHIEGRLNWTFGLLIAIWVSTISLLIYITTLLL